MHWKVSEVTISKPIQNPVCFWFLFFKLSCKIFPPDANCGKVAIEQVEEPAAGLACGQAAAAHKIPEKEPKAKHGRDHETECQHGDQPGTCGTNVIWVRVKFIFSKLKKGFLLNTLMKTCGSETISRRHVLVEAPKREIKQQMLLDISQHCVFDWIII